MEINRQCLGINVRMSLGTASGVSICDGTQQHPVSQGDSHLMPAPEVMPKHCSTRCFLPCTLLSLQRAEVLLAHSSLVRWAARAPLWSYEQAQPHQHNAEATNMTGNFREHSAPAYLSGEYPGQ